DAMEQTVGVADVDDTVAYTRRRLERPAFVLPFFRPLRQVEGVEVLIHRAGVDDTAGDGNGRFDGVVGRELPLLHELFRQWGGGDAGLEIITAEEDPFVLRGIVGRKAYGG